MKYELEPVNESMTKAYRIHCARQDPETDPWSQEADPENLTGKFASNPWTGRYDRRKKPRDNDGINFTAPSKTN